MRQSLCPTRSWKLPAGQTVHDGLPVSLLNVPLGHGAQLDFSVAPTLAENVPDGQRLQTEDPSASWKCPGGQVRQKVLPVPEENDPRRHGVQVLFDAAPTAAENVPDGHRRHRTEPGASW